MLVTPPGEDARFGEPGVEDVRVGEHLRGGDWNPAAWLLDDAIIAAERERSPRPRALAARTHTL